MLDQTLLVEVRSEMGVPVRGAQVLFDPVERAGQPDVYIAPAAAPNVPTSYRTLLDDTTNAQGRVAVRVRLGVHAGVAKLRLSALQLGFQDTARFTILPGKPAQVVVTPGDTAVYTGATFQASATVLDTWGNLRTDQATFAPLVDASVTATGNVTAGTKIARASYRATFAGASGTGWVSIVPHGTLIALRYPPYSGGAGSAVTFNLDGSGYQEIPSIYYFEAPSWTPSGTTFVFGGPRQPAPGIWLYTSDLSGNVHQLGTPGDSSVTWASWPVYSPDGQALYFSGYALPHQYSLWRVDADGRNPHLLYADPSGIAWRGSLSPDGTRLVFTAENPAIIRVYTIASGTVSAWRVKGHTPRWSPVSDSIAFATQWGGPIKLMSSDGTGARLVNARSYGETSIAWSPDGAWLVAKGAVLELINVASGLTLPLAYTGALAEPAWKP
jgi:hypothetical protein